MGVKKIFRAFGAGPPFFSRHPKNKLSFVRARSARRNFWPFFAREFFFDPVYLCFRPGAERPKKFLILFSFGAGRGSTGGHRGAPEGPRGGRGGAGGPLRPALASLSLVGGLPRKVFLTVGLLVN